MFFKVLAGPAINGMLIASELGVKTDNENLQKTLRLSESMLELARLVDQERREGQCGELFGLLRESAYKLRELAQDEVTRHKRDGRWE